MKKIKFILKILTWPFDHLTEIIIVSFINKFNEYILNDLDETISNNEINTEIDTIIIEKEKNNIPIKLGRKKILLTPRNFDLSQLSQDELIEILRILDVMIKDDSYDYLRTKIVEQIINVTSISFIKI